ncbi:MAG: DUF2326 domain-containing protein [Blastocatellia bacterium]|nr:DUF2326 domain-containing protein [Blastocatellia bacterium]
MLFSLVLLKLNVFFLELKLNDGRFLTIRRGVSQSTKISLKINLVVVNKFIDSKEWDFSDIPIKKAREELSLLASFNVLPDYPYRKGLGYFIRTQNDYVSVFELRKFGKGKHIYWKPFLFSLLGFDGQTLEKKYNLEAESEEQKRKISELEAKSGDSEHVDRIKGLIEIKIADSNDIKSKLDQFSFYSEESLLNNSLVEETEREIADLNSMKYNLTFELDEINKSLDKRSTFNLGEIEKVYKEVGIYFSDFLKKSYKDLIEFNKKISNERTKYLSQRKNDILKELQSVNSQLSNLDEKRIGMLSVLQGTDTFKKFKEFQKKLVELEADIIRYQSQIESISEVTKQKEKQREIANKILDQKNSIENQIHEGNSRYSKIRKTFHEIVHKIINQAAIISLTLNSQGNVDFEDFIPEEHSETEITSKGEGASYKKVLCVAFDLAILIAYRFESFFRFVYHDGVLEGLDNRKKRQFIELVRDICAKNDIQYILTTIEDDIPNKDKKGDPTFQNTSIFDEKEVILMLSDAGDEGKLFEQTF